MNRRKFLNSLLWAGGAAGLPLANHPLLAQTPFNDKFLIVLQLDGGWDVTAFCDPKMNVAGEQEISWWSRSDETREVGNLSYAPFASNQQFFEKYYQDMLVINGVDAQTNSHTVGVVHNWSGRNSVGYPSITSLYATSKAPELPMAYLNFGGFGNTERLIRSTRINDLDGLRMVLFPNEFVFDDSLSFQLPEELQRIKQYQRQSIERKLQQSGVPAGNRDNRQYYYEAVLRAEGLKEFANLLPADENIQPYRYPIRNFTSTLHQQIQVALLAFSSGVSVAADLFEGAYDTHANNDFEQDAMLRNSLDAIDFLWTSAEEMGLADRIVMLIGSDFGRTPYYNSQEGKDHWPIGSYIVMEKNAGYTNRVMGATDGGHFAYRVNPQDGTPDPIEGVTINPDHVHLALRKHLGIHNNGITNLFPFNNTEDFAFLS